MSKRVLEKVNREWNAHPACVCHHPVDWGPGWVTGGKDKAHWAPTLTTSCFPSTDHVTSCLTFVCLSSTTNYVLKLWAKINPSFLKLLFVRCLVTASRKITKTIKMIRTDERNLQLCPKLKTNKKTQTNKQTNPKCLRVQQLSKALLSLKKKKTAYEKTARNAGILL